MNAIKVEFLDNGIFINGYKAERIAESSAECYQTPRKVGYFLKLYYEYSSQPDNYIKLWNKYKNTELGQYLCPLLGFGRVHWNGEDYNWILQPICSTRKIRLRRDEKRLYDAVEKMKISDIIYNSKYKRLQEEQWGYLNNNPVVFDYGFHYNYECEDSLYE